jgi:uncharacterized protein
MSMPKVSALYIYPIKGCTGIELSGARLDPRGLLLDRAFMVVDAHGRFLSQRELPRMALVRTKLAPTALTLEGDGMRKLAVPLATQTSERVRVQVWDDTLMAEPVLHARAWLREFLDVECDLVRFADEVVRGVDQKYAPADARVSFADAFPILLLSEASLAALNTRLPHALPMNRFRPNVVVTGTEAHAEDAWRHIRIGDVDLDIVKPCSRCSVPTVDQLTAQAGKEPSATLAKYRRKDNKVYFGSARDAGPVGVRPVAHSAHGTKHSKR